MDKLTLYSLYRQQGWKALKCAGYHPSQNKESDPEKRYKRAKEPIIKGYTDEAYKSLTLEECEKWEDEGGWIGWLMPQGMIALDVEDAASIQTIKTICAQKNITPPEHNTNNGKHFLFKTTTAIPGNSKAFTKAGITVTYRAGGKNQLILAPVNGRTWAVPLNGDLPEIPVELTLYDHKDKDDVLNVLSVQVGEARRAGLLSGYEDIDAAFMGLLIEAGIEETRICEAFKKIFQNDYDDRKTSQMYQRAKNRIGIDEQVRGAGSFIHALKEKGLKELERLAGSITGKSTEGSKDLLSSLMKWNDILNLDVRTEYLLSKLIPKNSITLLFGRGGIGKTSLMMQIGRSIAGGLPFGDLQTIITPVYYVDFENPLAVLKERVEKIGESDNLYVWHISNEIQPPKLDSTGWELYKQLPPGLIIFDTLRASHLSDENDSKPMSLIMGRLKELREMGFTILLLHHTPKGNDNTFKGSTALLDLCDHVLGLEEVKDLDGESIEFDCQNLYKLGTRMKTRYEPHSIYLTFNPEIKGFSVAVNPDIEKMEGIREILSLSPKPLKQNELRERIKNDLDLADKEARRLLRKGTGDYWTTEKGDKNSTIYRPINSVCQFDSSLTPRQTDKQVSLSSENLPNRPFADTSETIANTEFVSLSEVSKQTDKLNFTDKFDYCRNICMLTGAQGLCERVNPCPKEIVQ